MANISLKKNTIFSTVKTLSSVIFPLITFPYISRVLLSNNVGKINFGLSIVSYFSLLASLGISTHAIRECSKVKKDKKELGRIASQIFTINLITTGFAYLALGITLLFYNKIENYRLLIIIQSLSIVASTLGADWLNSAMEDFKYISIRTICFQMISLILMFIFIHRPDDYMKYAIISLLSSAGASITNIWYRRKYCLVRITKDIEWKKHIKPIIVLFVMILSQTIFNNLDMTMLGITINDREVGIYSAAHKIMNIVNQLVASLLWVIMPRLSQYFADNDYEKINALLRKVLGFYLFFGLPCAVGSIVIAKDLVIVAAGVDFAESAGVLQILMIGFVFMLFGGDFLGNVILLPSKKENIFMVACLVSTVINAVLNFYFIPLYGARAAAATTAFSELIILVILFFKRDKNIHINEKNKIIISPILGCVSILIVCIGCFGIKLLIPRMILSIGGSALSYFLINFIMKNDILMEIIASVKNRLREKA